MTRHGTCLAKQGKLLEAVEMYNKALTESRNADTLELRNATERKLKAQQQEAYCDLAKAEEEKELGNAAFKAGDNPTAVAHYTEALKRGPADKWPEAYKVYSNRAACYTKLLALSEGAPCLCGLPVARTQPPSPVLVWRQFLFSDDTNTCVAFLQCEEGSTVVCSVRSSRGCVAALEGSDCNLTCNGVTHCPHWAHSAPPRDKWRCYWPLQVARLMAGSKRPAPRMLAYAAADQTSQKTGLSVQPSTRSS